ncbi:autotransporter outer membrane beta-barrel domain-containing protein [Reyranella sp.]|uniref:autotransporter outer membrane beta-barrel domain-containing protein n=1 Tax=Reyranella sp. TaxID=1929291 RepID=UPI003C7CFC27
MRKHVSLFCGLAVLACCEISTAFGQTPASSVDIPLSYVFDSSSHAARLSINIGINGGAPRPYLFDTGSSLFNAAFDPLTWGNYSQYTSSVPPSTVANGTDVKLCYSEKDGCRGYVGNILQIPLLSFYAAGVTTTDTAPAATLTTPNEQGMGFQVNAAHHYTDPDTGTHNSFPKYFFDPDTKDKPVQEGLFYGVFGARISVDQLPKDKCPGSSDCYIAGGVFGQAIMPGAARQGFVVAANGQGLVIDPKGPQPDPPPPQKSATVSIGGTTRDVTNCNPCVTVGLTPQIIGQFAPVAMPTPTSAPGLIQWVAPTSPDQAPPFPNPYGGSTGNTSAPTDAMYFKVTVSGGTTTTATAFTLLDTGTKYYSLTKDFSEALTGTISITGLTPDEKPITGLPTATGTLFAKPNYYVDGSGKTNTIGIPFFTLNSVMFDLSDQVTGYTPFFVTAANLETTAGGPLIVSSSNVPLGLAGVISGQGGVTIDSGGAVQLSATNTYTGETMIGSTGGIPGTLLISGPGSIAASSGVVNNGVFDISRAWAPVSIKALSGTGQVNLGGQNLTITSGNGTFSGIIADGGEYDATGGSVTIAGGTQTFAGTNGYTGGTLVSGGTLNLTGTLIGGMTVMQGGTFNNSGTLDSLGGAGFLNQGITANNGTLTTDVLNTGSFLNNGNLTGTFANLGLLSGTGGIVGTLANAGIVAPGTPYGTMTVNGAYSQTSSGTLQVAVSSAGQASRLNVIGATGTASLAGSVLAQVQAGSTYAPRTTYTILQTTGGLSGGFSSVTSSSPFLLPSLSYDANNVYLTLQIGGFATAALNPQQQAIGTVLDSTAATATGDYATVLGTLASLSPAQVQPILTALSGNNYAGFSSAMVQGAQFFMNNFAGQATGGGPSGSSRVALAEACDVACDASSTPRWGAWGGAIGGLGTVGAGTAQGAVTYNAGGFAAGLDRALTDNFRAGVTVGYSGGTQWVSGFSGQGNSDTVQAGLYGNYASGPFYADGLVGYAYTNNRMTRPILIPGLAARTAFGQTGANQVFGQFETGYSFDIGSQADAFFKPFVRLQAYTGTQNGFTETGAQSLNLSVAQQTTNSLRSVIGAQLGASMDMGWRDRLAMRFRLGWSHEYADVSRPVTAALTGAPASPFTTFGISPVRDGVLLGLSASTAVAEATSLYLRYEGTLAGPDGSQALTAGVRMTW